VVDRDERPFSPNFSFDDPVIPEPLWIDDSVNRILTSPLRNEHWNDSLEPGTPNEDQEAELERSQSSI